MMVNIRDKRKSKGISQKEFASQLNVDQTAVSMWKRGKSMPKADKLPPLQNYLIVQSKKYSRDKGDGQRGKREALRMNQFYFWSIVIIAAIMGIFWKIKNTAQFWSLCRMYWRDRDTILLYFHDLDRLPPRIIVEQFHRKKFIAFNKFVQFGNFIVDSWEAYK